MICPTMSWRFCTATAPTPLKSLTLKIHLSTFSGLLRLRMHSVARMISRKPINLSRANVLTDRAWEVTSRLWIRWLD